MGLCKPEPEIYKLALEKLKLKPEEVAVIDDRQICLDTANILGFKTILFENNKKLKEDLEKLAVKI